MAIELTFFPDAERAAALNLRMHRELANSLRYVVGEAKDTLGARRDLDALLDALESGDCFPAGTFADYYAMVDAILGDDLVSAQNAFRSLAAAKPIAAGLHIAPLGGERLGGRSAQFQAMMNADPNLELGFLPPPPGVADAFEARLWRGWALLQRGLPELAREISAITREVIIAGSDPSKKMQFDGGSHYRLWGALFLNGQFHLDDLAIVEVLAHESAHSLLFGFCTYEALVENEDDELYASPLRADPRPMDGIYHATFVSARMHWAMTQLAASGILGDEDQARALAAAAKDLLNFDSGYQTVAQHGRLTALGAGLMQEAHAYIETVR